MQLVIILLTVLSLTLPHIVVSDNNKNLKKVQPPSHVADKINDSSWTFASLYDSMSKVLPPSGELGTFANKFYYNLKDVAMTTTATEEDEDTMETAAGARKYYGDFEAAIASNNFRGAEEGEVGLSTQMAYRSYVRQVLRSAVVTSATATAIQPCRKRVAAMSVISSIIYPAVKDSIID